MAKPFAQGHRARQPQDAGFGTWGFICPEWVLGFFSGGQPRDFGEAIFRAQEKNKVNLYQGSPPSVVPSPKGSLPETPRQTTPQHQGPCPKPFPRAPSSLLRPSDHLRSSLPFTEVVVQSKGLSRGFSNTTVQKHQFFSTQPSSQSNSHIHT